VKNVKSIIQTVQHVKKAMKSVPIAKRIIQNVTNVKHMTNIMRVNTLAVVIIVTKNKEDSTKQ